MHRAYHLLFVPSLNLIMTIGCVIVVLYFQESSNMEAAYGLAITLTMMMTSILLVYYLRTVKKWAVSFVMLFILFYAVIELSFLVANLEKFPHGGWFSLVMGSVFAIVMVAWIRSKNIIGSLKEKVRFSPYIRNLIQLSNDSKYEKFATHLVYMTISEEKRFVEKKIIDSIFSGKPKKADIYLFVHVNITDEPYTMNYTSNVIASDDIVWVNFDIGFRVELKLDFFFRQVLAELVKSKEINLGEAGEYQKLAGEQVLGDFKFIVHESFLSNMSELPWYDDVLMNIYFSIKKVSSSVEDWFGFDPSSVITEKSPIVISPHKELILTRTVDEKKGL